MLQAESRGFDPHRSYHPARSSIGKSTGFILRERLISARLQVQVLSGGPWLVYSVWKFMRQWLEWQTRRPQKPVLLVGVRVRIPPDAPPFSVSALAGRHKRNGGGTQGTGCPWPGIKPGHFAQVAEQADAVDSKSTAPRGREGSNPSLSTGSTGQFQDP